MGKFWGFLIFCLASNAFSSTSTPILDLELRLSKESMSFVRSTLEIQPDAAFNIKLRAGGGSIVRFSDLVAGLFGEKSGECAVSQPLAMLLSEAEKSITIHFQTGEDKEDGANIVGTPATFQTSDPFMKVLTLISIAVTWGDTGIPNFEFTATKRRLPCSS